MTTVAWDGETLAADSRMIGGYIDQIRCQKLHTYKGMVWGLAGEMQYTPVFERWLKAGMKPDAKPVIQTDADFEVLLIKDGVAYHYEKTLEGVPVGMPAAIGSGAGPALGAMLAGKNAKQAVQIAAKLDEGTGGPVQVITP